MREKPFKTSSKFPMTSSSRLLWFCLIIQQICVVLHRRIHSRFFGKLTQAELLEKISNKMEQLSKKMKIQKLEPYVETNSTIPFPQKFKKAKVEDKKGRTALQEPIGDFHHSSCLRERHCHFSGRGNDNAHWAVPQFLTGLKLAGERDSFSTQLRLERIQTDAYENAQSIQGKGTKKWMISTFLKREFVSGRSKSSVQLKVEKLSPREVLRSRWSGTYMSYTNCLKRLGTHERRHGIGRIITTAQQLPQEPTIPNLQYSPAHNWELGDLTFRAHLENIFGLVREAFMLMLVDDALPNIRESV
nr:uncharacterized protein LOC111987139 [Ipomoea batatas]